MINIVVGAGYGDEGKGWTVAKLAELGKCGIVVRFNGGHQAGHTVEKNGYRHVFSNFGAGSLHGVPTYWSDYCTINLRGMREEYELLVSNGYTPRLYIDPKCPVTTIWDMLLNQQQHKKELHGSVGVGFGATIERQLTMKFHAIDLTNRYVATNKFELVRKHYGYPACSKSLDEFFDDLVWFANCPDITIWDRDFEFVNPIFEGAQGILLDMDHGFYPHMTRSKCTAANAFELIERFGLDDYVMVNYITRAYHTRHGNGPFHERLEIKLRDDIIETNISHEYQGEFKTTMLDLDLLKFAYKAAESDLMYARNHMTNFILTCADHHEDEFFNVKYEDDIVMVDEKNLKAILNSWVGLDIMNKNALNG
jgi:adenylosuccinate synthase